MNNNNTNNNNTYSTNVSLNERFSKFSKKQKQSTEEARDNKYDFRCNCKSCREEHCFCSCAHCIWFHAHIKTFKK